MSRLRGQKDQRTQELAKLRQKIEDGRRSGPPRPADEGFDRLEAKYREMSGSSD